MGVITPVKDFPQRVLIFLGAAALLTAIGFFDYWTGYNVSVFVLYAFPVAWVAWSLGLAIGSLFSVAGALTWLWADLASGHPYLHRWMAIDRFINVLVLLAFIAISFHFFRRTLSKRQEHVRRLEGLLSVCPTCRRIRSEEGTWTDLSTFLAEQTHVDPLNRLCPNCAREHYLAGYEVKGQKRI